MIADPHPTNADDESPAAGSGPVPANVGPENEAEGEIGQLSTDEILAELSRRQDGIHLAHQRRTRLLQQLAEVEMEIVRLGGSIPGRAAQPMGSAPLSGLGNGPGSAATGAAAADLNNLTLPRAIAQVVRIGEIFSPKQATERLLEAGYRTRAQNFGTAVTQALGREKNFRRVGHGRYERVG